MIQLLRIGFAIVAVPISLFALGYTMWWPVENGFRWWTIGVELLAALFVVAAACNLSDVLDDENADEERP